MFQKFKSSSRLFTRPLSSQSGGRSARIIPSLNVKLNQNLFTPEISFSLLQVQSMNRCLSTLSPQLSEKISPEIEQLLEISLEERSLEEDDGINGVRIAKSCHTTSCEMFIKSIISKYVEIKDTDDWKNLHLKDLGLKFRILRDLQEEKSEKFDMKFGNVELANIFKVSDILKVLNSPKVSLNPWSKNDSFKEYMGRLLEKEEWPMNVTFKRVEKEVKPLVSKIPLY